MRSNRKERHLRGLVCPTGRAKICGFVLLTFLSFACGPLDSSDSVRSSARALAASGGTKSCAPGLVLCGEQCLDLSKDADHCGACAIKCSPGVQCVKGTCGGQLTSQQTSSATVAGPTFNTWVTVVQVSGGNPMQECRFYNEGYPELSLTSGGTFIGYQDAASYEWTNRKQYNWGEWSGQWWNPTVLNYQVASGWTVAGDPWATSSASTGLEYISSMLKRPGTPIQGCLGIGAATYSDLMNGLMTYPMDCINTVHSNVDDGPSIFFDPGQATLWATAVNWGTGTRRLYVMEDCRRGQPGGPNCRVTADVAVDRSQTHGTVTVNPCGHDGILAYRKGNLTGNVVLEFYAPNGGLRTSFTVASGSTRPFGQVTKCKTEYAGCDSALHIPKCGQLCSRDCSDDQEGPCMRVADKVQVATKHADDGRCLAYVTYNFLYPYLGKNYMKTALDIVDITDEQWGVVRMLKSYQSSYDNSNDFEPTTTASFYTDKVGWFFYRQLNNEACNTYYWGYVDMSLGTSSMQELPFISGPFRSMRLGGTQGIGDYTGIIKGGLNSGADFFPTWSETNQMSPGYTCAPCLGYQHSLVIKGAVVHLEP